MVYEDLDRKRCAREEMAPVVKAINETHKFPIPNVVVSFRSGQGVRGGT
jgi:hypothetical protein